MISKEKEEQYLRLLDEISREIDILDNVYRLNTRIQMDIIEIDVTDIDEDLEK